MSPVPLATGGIGEIVNGLLEQSFIREILGEYGDWNECKVCYTMSACSLQFDMSAHKHPDVSCSALVLSQHHLVCLL